MNISIVTKSFVKRELKRNYIPTIIPSQNYDYVVKESKLGFLPLDIEIPYTTINKEINVVDNLFVDHREDEGNIGWQGFCIYGKSYDATRGDEYYHDNRISTWTNEALEFMPNTVNFFKNNWFNNSFNRIRIMKLLPSGYINLHADNELPGALGAVNIAIDNPKENLFAMDNHGIIPFKNGKAIMLNVAYKHAVINESKQPRYHIIVHHNSVTESFKTCVINSYNNYKR